MYAKFMCRAKRTLRNDASSPSPYAGLVCMCVWEGEGLYPRICHEGSTLKGDGTSLALMLRLPDAAIAKSISIIDDQ